MKDLGNLPYGSSVATKVLEDVEARYDPDLYALPREKQGTRSHQNARVGRSIALCTSYGQKETSTMWRYRILNARFVGQGCNCMPGPLLPGTLGMAKID